MQPETTTMRLAYLHCYHQMVALPDTGGRRAYLRATRLDPFSRYRLGRSLDEFESKLPAYIALQTALTRRLGRGYLEGVSPPWLRARVARRLAVGREPSPLAAIESPAVPAPDPTARRLALSLCWLGLFSASALALLFGLITLGGLIASIDTAVVARA